MLKVKFNSSAKILDEARTITPSARLVRELTEATNAGFYNFLKVVVDNRLVELENKLADVLAKSRVKNLPVEELDKLKEYEVILNKKIGEINDLIDLNEFKETTKLEKKSVLLAPMQQMLAGTTLKGLKPNVEFSYAAIPVEALIDFMLMSPQSLTALKKNISPVYAKQTLMQYFNERNLTDLHLNFKIIKVDPRTTQDLKSEEFEKWAGLYDSDRLTILISIPDWYLNDSKIADDKGNVSKYPGKLFNLGTRPGYDAKAFVNEAKIYASDFPKTIRHELQHVMQHLYGVIKDIKWVGLAKVSSFRNKPYDMYGQAINPKTGEVLRDPKTGKAILWRDQYGEALPHHMVPVEAATDVQDELESFAEKFNEDLEKILKSKTPQSAELQNNFKLVYQIVRELFKVYVGAEKDAPLARNYNFKSLFYWSQVFNSYKKENRDLYKWAIKKGYDFIDNDMYMSLFNKMS